MPYVQKKHNFPILQEQSSDLIVNLSSSIHWCDMTLFQASSKSGQNALFLFVSIFQWWLQLQNIGIHILPRQESLYQFGFFQCFDQKGVLFFQGLPPTLENVDIILLFFSLQFFIHGGGDTHLLSLHSGYIYTYMSHMKAESGESLRVQGNWSTKWVPEQPELYQVTLSPKTNWSNKQINIFKKEAKKKENVYVESLINFPLLK